MAIYHTPRTPSSTRTRRKEGTTRRKAKFYHAIDTRAGKSIKEASNTEGIKERTAYYWLKLRRLQGSPGTRRVGKRRTGAPFKIPSETLGQILAKSNPVRTERLEHQIQFFRVAYCLRTL